MIGNGCDLVEHVMPKRLYTELKMPSSPVKEPGKCVSTVTAQITVTIDQDGNFMNAEPVDLNDKLTIIPVTEKSGSRTAGKEPHPLCDNLRYLAGDYTKYYKDDGICHELYISQLKEWVESEYCHEKVRAIYLYLKKIL